jgi:phosphoadenosine phosphosulfate reductase
MINYDLKSRLLSVFISVALRMLNIFIPTRQLGIRMRNPYLGKLALSWCDLCHVPVLGPRCACGTETRHVPVTPPGDIRPAFPRDIDRINTVYRAHFGVNLVPPRHLALLNKVPDPDRMEEIIVGGAVVGAIRYLPAFGRWEPLPHQAAKDLMKPVRRYLVVDEDVVPFLQKGASVLAPGLSWIDDAVENGDEVMVYGESGICAGVGRARVSAATARFMKHGMIVRMRKNAPSCCVPAEATWDEAIRANEKILTAFEDRAIHFVQDIVAEFPDRTPIIAYSGGKDSLATLILVLRGIGKVPILFADSGFEFEETCQNVEQVACHYGLELVKTTSSALFEKVFEEKGPPAINARWCCAVCKLQPVNAHIEKRWGNCLSFIGQRRYESHKRMKSSSVWRNKRVPRQLAASPIHEWTALHVWLYLFREGAPYNALYEQGFDRIGCYICPSSDLATLRLIEETRPHLWKNWMNYLESWRAMKGLPQDWIIRGEWRKQHA